MMAAELEALRQSAKQASQHAYVPYSHFPVGAVVTAGQLNQQFAGCNVENGSYSITLCAERNALGQAIASGVKPGQLNRIAIYMPGDKLYSPCGACRQFIAELVAADAVIYAFCDSDNYKHWTVAELLPDGFEL